MCDESLICDALERVGIDEIARRDIINALLEWESRNFIEGEDLRTFVTGPIVDALHTSIPNIYRTTQDGLNFEIPYDSRIAREVAMGASHPSHIWEPQTTKLLVKLAAQAKTVIIGGAFIGDHAVPVGRIMADTGGAVYCFEVQEHYANALRRNISANGLANVHVIDAGLWNEPAWLTLIGSDVIASTIPGEEGSDSFPATTIDTFASENAIDNVDLIVLDIEGGEFHALQGAAHFLSRASDKSPVLVFEIHRDYVDWSQGLSNTPIIEYLRNHGYQVFGIRDYQANIEIGDLPIELVELDGMYLEGPSHGFNVIAVKDLSLLNDLGLGIRRDTSPKLLRHRSSDLHQPGR
jgi:FkbM family methyltransferase